MQSSFQTLSRQSLRILNSSRIHIELSDFLDLRADVVFDEQPEHKFGTDAQGEGPDLEAPHFKSAAAPQGELPKLLQSPGMFHSPPAWTFWICTFHLVWECQKALASVQMIPLHTRNAMRRGELTAWLPGPADLMLKLLLRSMEREVIGSLILPTPSTVSLRSAPLLACKRPLGLGSPLEGKTSTVEAGLEILLCATGFGAFS